VTSGRLHHYTYADYVAVERDSSTKHEFLDGEIYAMAGGTEDHATLAAEVLRALGNAIGDRACRVLTSDLRVFVAASELATFPDGSVISGALEQHEQSPRDTALNPTILLEVTSDSSEDYDTGTKLEIYRAIPTLREYIVVSHRRRSITVHTRDTDGTWSSQNGGAGGRVGVASLAADLDVDTIYRRTTLV
jgi:Uma2 family endonuclease